jgi:hypothetical protein
MVVAGLVQAALMSHRMPVFPSVPCESAWLHPPGTDDLGREPGKECHPPIWPKNDRFR